MKRLILLWSEYSEYRGRCQFMQIGVGVCEI